MKEQFNRAGKLDKDDPTIRNAIKIVKEIGIISLDDISIKFESPQDFTEFFGKLRKEYRLEFIKGVNDSPNHLKLNNTKSPTAFIDTSILEDALNAMPCHGIIQTVRYHVEKTIDGINWAELHKT